MQIHIRPYRNGDDLEAITELLHAAYKQHADAGLQFWATHQSPADTAQRISEGFAFVALLDDVCVGTITIRPPNPTSAVELYRNPLVRGITQFAVHPGYMGKGIGTLLHDAAIQYALEGGATTLALDTAKPATSLIAMYERWGYQICGTADWRPMTNYESVVLKLEIA